MKKSILSWTLALFLIPAAAGAAPITLATSPGNPGSGWLAFAPGPNQTGNGNINTAGLAYETGAGAGWNSNLGFNDTGWSTYAGGWFPAGPGGSPSPWYLRKEFTLGTPTAGTFTAWADDDIQVWVNGVLVINDTNGGTGGGPYTANILSALVTGNNLIALKMHNTFGGGFSMISFSGSADSTPVAAPAPAALALVGFGLLALGAFRRRAA